MPWLINAAQLDKFRKNQKSLIIFDASWFLPNANRNPQQEFNDKHILDAHFLDITAFNDPQSSLPNQLSLDETFLNERLSQLGIRNDYKIIFYDNSDLHTACRAAWMFKVFGHNPHLLYVLDGGLAAWEKDGGKVAAGLPSVTPKNYTVNLQPQYVRTLAQMKEQLVNPTAQIIDLRHPVRFCGGPESRAGMRAGHIPKSFNFPYFTMFDQDGKFLEIDKIKRKFWDVSISAKLPMILTCGSGITSATLDFILDIMGHQDHAIYDGSWSEWGADTLYAGENDLSERPVETCLEELNDIPQV